MINVAPALVETPLRTWEKARATIDQGVLTVFDKRRRPLATFHVEQVETTPARRGPQAWTVTTSEGTVHVERMPGCGCGSTIEYPTL